MMKPCPLYSVLWCIRLLSAHIQTFFTFCSTSAQRPNGRRMIASGVGILRLTSTFQGLVTRLSFEVRDISMSAARADDGFDRRDGTANDEEKLFNATKMELAGGVLEVGVVVGRARLTRPRETRSRYPLADVRARAEEMAENTHMLGPAVRALPQRCGRCQRQRCCRISGQI